MGRLYSSVTAVLGRPHQTHLTQQTRAHMHTCTHAQCMHTYTHTHTHTHAHHTHTKKKHQANVIQFRNAMYVPCPRISMSCIRSTGMITLRNCLL